MMKKAVKCDNRGLTLVELIVGVVIFAIIVTPLLHVFVTGANTVKKTKQYNDATVAAKNIIEYISSTDMKTVLAGKQTEESGEHEDSYLFSVTGNPNSIGSTVADQLSRLSCSGGSNFNAKIIVDTDNPLNSKGIPFSNQMDAVFQMQDVDETALTLFRNSADKEFSKLKRYITIDAENMEGSSLCKLTVTFEYSGTAKKVETDSQGKTTDEIVLFSYSTQSVMNITPRTDTGTAFSAYLFFKAYKWDNEYFQMGKTNINNKTIKDVSKNWKARGFNVFLVDVGDSTKDVKTEVEYRPNEPGIKVGLMTNMGNTTFKAYTLHDSIWHTPKDIPVNLVETAAIDRVYNITVEIYKGSNKIADMSTSKLDYSAQ